MDNSVNIAGELANWPDKIELTKILRAGGLNVTEGDYCIRVNDCSHFVFQEYGSDLGDPQIEAEADSLEIMICEGGMVSKVLAGAGLKHRFEIYDTEDNIVGYLHHDWPNER